MEKNISTYIVYNNDLKHYNINNDHIINGRAILYNNNNNINTLKYRLKECKKESNETLDLQSLSLTKMIILPKYIYKSLKNLFIGNNNLTMIPNLSEFNNLEILDINNNKIKIINDIPKTLIELCCRNNEIETININNNSVLERLDCNKNKLKKIMNVFNNCKNLKHVDCNNNMIDEKIYHNGIEQLFCYDNKIKEICDFPNLIYLDCKNNPLSKINNLNKLEHIVCSNTLLLSLDNLINIKTIECFQTKISEIPYLPNLYEILCDNGQIKKISSLYKIGGAEIYNEYLLYITFII